MRRVPVARQHALQLPHQHPVGHFFDARQPAGNPVKSLAHADEGAARDKSRPVSGGDLHAHFLGLRRVAVEEGLQEEYLREAPLDPVEDPAAKRLVRGKIGRQRRARQLSARGVVEAFAQRLVVTNHHVDHFARCRRRQLFR
jgi:hypothetical protein